MKKLDVATRIMNLSLEIRHLCDEYKLNRSVIIEDFIDLVMAEFEESKDEDN